MATMTFGQKKFQEVIDAMIKQGKVPTEEQLKKLESISKEIDELYETILKNQAAFGNIPFIKVNDPNPWTNGEYAEAAFGECTRNISKAIDKDITDGIIKDLGGDDE